MASASDLAVLLGEAAQIYYTDKAFQYQQIKDRQAQVNLEIDRDLATERYNNTLQADVYKSEIQRLGRRSDVLNAEVIKNQAKYEGLTGEFFKLTPESKTEGGTKVLGDMENAGMLALSNELGTLRAEQERKTIDLSNLLSRISAIDRMRADMIAGGGGPAIAGDPNVYEKEDFSYQEYLDRTETTGTDWLQSGYREINPTELMKLNTDAMQYDYKRAVTGIYRGRGDGNLDPAAMYKAVDNALKSHYSIILDSQGIGKLQATQTVLASFSETDREQGNPRYKQYSDKLVLDKLELAAKADPVGYTKVMKGFQMSGWEGPGGEPYSIDEYVHYISPTGDPDFKDDVAKKMGKKDTYAVDFAKRADMLNEWVEGVVATHLGAIQNLKGMTGIQGTGLPLLELVDERKAQWDELIRTGQKELADKLVNDFFNVSGVRLDNPNSISTFRSVVHNQGTKALKDGSLNPVINPIKGPNEVFKGSQDEVFLKELKMRADKDPNDLSLQEELDSMTLILYNKYGDAELSAGMAGW